MQANICDKKKKSRSSLHFYHAMCEKAERVCAGHTRQHVRVRPCDITTVLVLDCGGESWVILRCAEMKIAVRGQDVYPT